MLSKISNIKISKIITRFLIVPGILLLIFSCQEDRLYESFYKEQKLTIASFIEANKDSFSYYYELIKSNDMMGSLSAYNPYGNNYTLFLPSNDAFEKYFNENPNYKSMEELLADKVYSHTLARYHIVNSAFRTNDFPYGSLPDTTATGELLIIAIDTASSRPKVNGEAFIIRPDIEVLNGFIHVIDKVLEPVTSPVSSWIEQREHFSIFRDALELTGLKELLGSVGRYTLMVETNLVFNAKGIFSVEDLITRYSPDNINFTEADNGLYRFIAYHILDDIFYLDDFEGQVSNYNTLSVYPVRIDGIGLNIRINQGVGVLDTLITGTDTTLINYLSLQYDVSNNQTSNGAIHLINHVMEPFLPVRSVLNFQFHNEPIINAIRNEAAIYEFPQEVNFQYIQWTGSKSLTFVKSPTNISNVFNNDYIILEGNFTMTYHIPKILPGRYNLYITAHATSVANAMVDVILDGKQIGGSIDLSSGGTNNIPFYTFLLGTVDLNEYALHTIGVRTVIPGRFMCDRFTFEPIN
jgi:uncharacterized surface protein with fasciclin (FAS1) repeats